MIETITYTKEKYPEVIEIINELAKLEERRPHDSGKRLIIEAGKKKIESMKKF